MTENYITSYCNFDIMKCFAAAEDHNIIGTALAIVVPSIDVSYLRIEDFCITFENQRKGIGILFINGIFKEAVRLGCDSILLGT